jgi:hypothetical protein
MISKVRPSHTKKKQKTRGHIAVQGTLGGPYSILESTGRIIYNTQAAQWYVQAHSTSTLEYGRQQGPSSQVGVERLWRRVPGVGGSRGMRGMWVHSWSVLQQQGAWPAWQKSETSMGGSMNVRGRCSYVG